MVFQVAELEAFSIACLSQAGVPVDEAMIITQTMIEADAKGIHSHGLMRLPIYIDRIHKGLIAPTSNVVVEHDQKSTAVMNGNKSAGQVVGTKAIQLAITKAEEYGIGAVLAKNSNHFGIAAHYAQIASNHNMIGIIMSNTAPLMPPVGGAEKVLGNNPLAIAAPTNHSFPLLLDMALSNAALGKIIYAKTNGIPIPDGWGADKNGIPTTDPSDVLDGGFILPVGGPKGFGLALMIELLTGVLANSQFSKSIPSMYDLTQAQSISHFMLVINIEHFIEIERFKSLAGLLSSYVKDAVKAEGVNELYLPGEIEFNTEVQRMRTGIPVADHVVEDLNKLAQVLEVPRLV